MVNTGTTKRCVYTPAELVELIDGQPLRRKLTADETRDMIEFACRSPVANATSIVTTGRSALSLVNNPILVSLSHLFHKAKLLVLNSHPGYFWYQSLGRSSDCPRSGAPTSTGHLCQHEEPEGHREAASRRWLME